ncbi:MAG: hypothetical protein JXB36_10050 [Gammaproteobacteria bacterium]|nr:hypothetical protein [Gammaproteobacteria bacterium]
MSGSERGEHGLAMGRREFLGSAMLVAGGIAASALLPWPGMAQAEPVELTPEPLADWNIDDMWGVWPRYAEPIGYGHAAPEAVAAAGSIEELFYA